MKRRSLCAVMVLSAAGCVTQGNEPEATSTEQAVTTCLPSGSYCKAQFPTIGYYTGAIPQLASTSQSFVAWECNGEQYGGVADLGTGQLTWAADVSKALGDFFAKAATATVPNGGTTHVVKIPPGPHPHCPSAGEILYWAQGADDLMTTAPAANAACLGT